MIYPLVSAVDEDDDNNKDDDNNNDCYIRPEFIITSSLSRITITKQELFTTYIYISTMDTVTTTTATTCIQYERGIEIKVEDWC